MLKIFSDFIESIENSEDICLSMKTDEGGVININNNVLANYRLRNLPLIRYLPNSIKAEKNAFITEIKNINLKPGTVRLNETTVILNLVNDFTIKVKFNLSPTIEGDDNASTKLSINLTVVNRRCGIATIDLKDLVEFSTVFRSMTDSCWVKASCKSINKTGYKKSISFKMDDQISQIKLFGNNWDSEMSALPDIKHFISFIIEESLENNEDLCDLIIKSIDDEN
jgi:hypothetical protein